MARLLHIDASLDPAESVSRAVAASFREAWQGEVVYRDLGKHPVPHLTGAGVAARAVDRAEHTPEQAVAASLQDELISEVESADAYLFAVPMYNFSIPSAFKAWIDQIIVPGRLYHKTPEEGPLYGRPATLIAVRGGAYGPGTPREGWDFAEPYLRTIFEGCFGLDLHVIMAEMTLAASNPDLAAFLDHRRESIERAHAAAAERARSLSLQHV